MILFLTTEKQSGWNKNIHEARPCAKTRVAFCASEYEYFFARHEQWTCKPSDLKGQRIGNKLANETTTSCQLVQNFLVCAVETSRLHKLKRFGLIGRHSKLYCLCSRDIQNFIVCAIATFTTLLFVQSRHSKLFSLCVPSGAPYLGDIVQNIAKMNIFCSFSEGSLGRVLQKLAKIEQISIFSINFTNCQLNCINFVKEQWNLARIIILPSCAEELRTAKHTHTHCRPNVIATPVRIF